MKSAPFYVPENTKCFSLLQTLRSNNKSIALVVDEYGLISGLITQEDIIESVIGEITDLREKKRFTRDGKDVIIASGSLDLNDFYDMILAAVKKDENEPY